MPDTWYVEGRHGRRWIRRQFATETAAREAFDAFKAGMAEMRPCDFLSMSHQKGN